MSELKNELLVAARKSLHQAVQLVSAVPRNVLPKDPSDGMASLAWNSTLKSLEALPVFNNHGQIITGLAFETFTLFITVNHIEKATLPMSGKSVNQGLEWLKAELTKLDIAADAINLDLPYEIENYDYSASLASDSEANKEFARLYDMTAGVLTNLRKKWDNSYDIRCWPHHFDLATLIPLETDKNDEITKSIGIGFSPGDNLINEPYIYVNIWPEVAADTLQKHQLPLGKWHSEGWSGAVLTYQQMNETNGLKDAFDQFINSVIDILLEETK